jgi:hypothetical protein
MGSDRDSLRFKIKSIGGFKAILGRSGKDFYMALLFSFAYLLIVYERMYNIDYWSDYMPSITFVIGPIAAELAIISNISRSRQDVISNTVFNKKLDQNDLLASVEFFYDYPNEIAHCSLYIWLLFTAIWFISAQGFISILPNNLIAYLFAIPIFSLIYSFLNFYYTTRATQIYKRLEIKYS